MKHLANPASRRHLTLVCATTLLTTACGRVGGPARAAQSSAETPPPAPTIPAAERLQALGARFRPWQPPPLVSKTTDTLKCGVDDGVMLLRGPTGVRYSKPPRVRGEFALKLARLEVIAQEEARRVFRRPLARIDHAGTYVCRTIAGATTASQHSFGNAIDVTAFVLKGGRRIGVGRDFVRNGSTPTKPGGEFLARVLERVYAERLFRTVLTPDWDARHASHLHLDDRPGFGSWWRRLLG